MKYTLDLCRCIAVTKPTVKQGESEHLTPDSVIWGLSSLDKLSAIREVIYRAPAFARVPGLNLDELCASVIQREMLQTTGFGHGVAVAHGRSDRVGRCVVALGVARDGIEFHAADGNPVHMLFVVASNPDRQIDYLRILASLVSVVRDDRFRGQLLSCTSPHDLHQMLLPRVQQSLARYGVGA